MRLFVDEQPVPVSRHTLAAALDAGRAAAAARQRVIVEVKVDGVRVADATLDSPGDEPLGDADVRLMTAEPRALVRLSLLDTRDALDGLAALQADAAGHLQAGRLARGLTVAGEALEVWSAVRRVAHEGPALLGADHRTLAAAGRPLAGRAGELAELLGQVRGALSAQDWSLLADLLEGDLTDAARAWRAVLADLADQAAAGQLGRRPEPSE